LCTVTETVIYINLLENVIWQVLLDKGVLVDEIKLYGEEENDDRVS